MGGWFGGGRLLCEWAVLVVGKEVGGWYVGGAGGW